MDAISAKLWSDHVFRAAMKTTIFDHILMPPPLLSMQGPPAPPVPKTVREQLSEIISEFMAYDGDPDGAADAVMEFYRKGEGASS